MMKTTVIPEPINKFKVQNNVHMNLDALVHFPQLSNDIKQTKIGMLYFSPNDNPRVTKSQKYFSKMFKIYLAN